MNEYRYDEFSLNQKDVQSAWLLATVTVLILTTLILPAL